MVVAHAVHDIGVGAPVDEVEDEEGGGEDDSGAVVDSEHVDAVAAVHLHFGGCSRLTTTGHMHACM